MSKDLQYKLQDISQDLGRMDIKNIVFLCEEKLSTIEKEEIKDGYGLFLILQKRDLVSEDNLSFLKEILCKIHRKDILKKHLHVTPEELTSLEHSSVYICPYRSLLYDISQSADTKVVEKICFVLYSKQEHLRKANSLIDVLRQMEKDGKLSKDNVADLKVIMKSIKEIALFKKIEEYEKQGGQACLASELETMCIQESSPNQPDIQEDSPGSDKPLEKYKLDKTPHGWCVIVNNEVFKEAKRNRNGTNKDAEAIKKVFEKRDYIIKEHKNLTGQKLLEIMQFYGQKDHSNMDSFLCFVLSHGDKGTVCGTDDECMSIKDLTKYFDGINCKSLVGKPKVFFIQACQGDELDKGANYEKDVRPMNENNGTNTTLPITADFLTAYASVEDYASLRHAQNGSVYIQELCSTLEDPRFMQEDLKNILTSVQKKIADGNYKYEGCIVKQMPSYKSELRKELILPPKLLNDV